MTTAPFRRTRSMISRLIEISRARPNELTPAEHDDLRAAALHAEKTDEAILTLMRHVETACEISLLDANGERRKVTAIYNHLMEQKQPQIASVLMEHHLSILAIQQAANNLLNELGRSDEERACLLH